MREQLGSYYPPEAMVANPVEVDILTEADMWESQGASIWVAKRFEGKPVFYPVFRCDNLFSYSPFLLALAKGSVEIDEGFVNAFEPVGDFCPIGQSIDKSIRRIGGPLEPTFSIRSTDEFLRRFIEAIQADIDRIESRNPGKKNYILAGGKDSLNLLLFRWTNEVSVVSAKPNFELVSSFVEENELPYPVYELKDVSNSGNQSREVAEAFCRYDLKHIRWVDHLCRIASDEAQNCVFWTGALGDVFMTPYWQRYSGTNRLTRGVGRYLPHALAAPVMNRTLVPATMKRMWTKGAAWQGGSVGHHRSLTNCLTLSPYHGREAVRVLEKANLAAISMREDVRDRFGEMLFGKPVKYPESNPGPEPSDFRSGLWEIEPFIHSVREFGIEVKRGEPR